MSARERSQRDDDDDDRDDFNDFTDTNAMNDSDADDGNEDDSDVDDSNEDDASAGRFPSAYQAKRRIHPHLEQQCGHTIRVTRNNRSKKKKARAGRAAAVYYCRCVRCDTAFVIRTIRSNNGTFYSLEPPLPTAPCATPARAATPQHATPRNGDVADPGSDTDLPTPTVSQEFDDVRAERALQGLVDRVTCDLDEAAAATGEETATTEVPSQAHRAEDARDTGEHAAAGQRERKTGRHQHERLVQDLSDALNETFAAITEASVEARAVVAFIHDLAAATRMYQIRVRAGQGDAGEGASGSGGDSQR